MRRRVVLLAAVALLLAGAAYGAGPPQVRKGEPLAAALAALREAGLGIIFSTALIGPELRVEVEPGAGTPEEIARRLLAPHGLRLEAIRPGIFSVVRDVPAENGQAASTASAARDTHPTGATADDLQEVDIYASRYTIEQQESTAALAELSRADIEALPGLSEDVLRVPRFLPGTAASPLSARAHVRGGREDELAVFFDGVPLFEPFHYKDVQSLLGMLDPESIATIDYFSGVFPVRYGNRLSGVLDITPRTYAGENYNAIGASVLYSHAITQGRLDSHPLEWLASARRANVDLFADLLGRREAEPNFLDALGRAQLDIGERSSLVAGWLLLDDELSASLDDGAEAGNIEYRDATGWLSWRMRPTDDSALRATVSRTERHTNRVGSVDQPGYSRGTLDDRRRFDTTTVRLEARVQALPRLELTTGLEWYDYDATYDYVSDAAFNPDIAAALGRSPTHSQRTALRSTGEAYAAYASGAITVAPRTTLDLAIRWDAQRFGTAFRDDQISPRVGLQYDYDAATTLRASWGRAAQTLRPDELPVQDGELAFARAQFATQTVLSIERRFAPIAVLRVELYDKRIRDPSPEFENVLDPFALLPELEVDRVRIAPDRSRAYGSELSVRWQASDRWSGWASYTFSEATDDFGDTHVPRTWDQKHALATGLAWTARPWRLSGNVTWHSGWRSNSLIATSTGFELAPRNAASWAPYFSLDARASWTHALRRGALDAYLEIDNLTNHDNPCCSSYRLSSTGGPRLTREDSGWLPRVFLLGVTWQLP
ncbi:MAG TPA: TonB-dependent receptor [Steroidobacteraceae bacterium]|nr:TonB-dependent receptor [Steroidobacteraceae bacterium]